MKVKKDPNAVLDYTWNWSAWLGADTILAASFETTGGLVVDAQVVNGPLVTAWVSGGTAEEGTVTCRITTAGLPARIDDRTLIFQIVQR